MLYNNIKYIISVAIHMTSCKSSHLSCHYLVKIKISNCMNDEIITKQQGDIHNSIDKPKACITLEDFNGGDGFAKMNLECT